MGKRNGSYLWQMLTTIILLFLCEGCLGCLENDNGEKMKNANNKINTKINDVGKKTKILKKNTKINDLEKNKNNLISWLDNILNPVNNAKFFNLINTRGKCEIFVKASIFDKDKYTNTKEEFNKKYNENDFTELEKACIGSILGMAIGDAIGARVEFWYLNYNFNGIKDMGKNPAGKFKLEPGQWTDDTSMGLCLADSLIEKKGEFDPRDIMMRFILWWYCGYNNAFRFEKNREKKDSVGLGGNISGSIEKYIKDKGKDPYTTYGDRKTSGNGSIMRNAAIPICYFRKEKEALENAKNQSLITHQGDEAAGCCQLMTYIIVKILKLKMQNKEETLKKILNDLKYFKCDYDSVNYLAHSQQEGDDKNRNWNWKNPNFRYSEDRAKSQPGYIGSYCMDGLAMALHVLYTTNSFEEAILKGVNLCGDADSVGSIIGQIAGAYYGSDSIPKDWIKAINKWDNNEIALRGYILYKLKGNK